MAQFKDFDSYVALDVQGCPASVMRQAIALAVLDFCRRSRVWRAECSAGATQTGVGVYTIVAPEGGAVSAVEWVTVGGNRIAELCYTQDAGALSLAAAFAPGRAIVAKSILVPLQTASKIPDALLDYAEGIASGAKFRLMMQPGKPWSSPDLAAAHRTLFENAIGDAFARSESAGRIGSKSVSPLGAFGRHY